MRKAAALLVGWAVLAGCGGTASPSDAATEPGAARAAAAVAGATIWPASAVPSVVDAGPDSPVELGVRFRADSAGTITGIRFYKASANTGTHVGNLWTSGGTLLATATFTGETGSGWQQVNFATPVSIAANTVYVASYHTNVGHYGADQYAFASAGVDRPPLHALRNGTSGSNGSFAYGSRSAFPNQGYRSTNYWVDVVFVPASASLASVAVAPGSVSLSTGATQQLTASGTYSDGSTRDLTATATWSSSATPVATVSAGGLVKAVGPGTATISATANGVTGRTTVTVTSAPPLSISTTSLPAGSQGVAYSATLAAAGGTPPYTWSIPAGLPPGLTLGATTGAIAGTPTTSGAFSFTTQVTDSRAQTASAMLSIVVAAPASRYSIWATSATPSVVDGGPDASVEVGVKFRADSAGTITGIRFYKSTANTGTHVGNLWTSSGTLLASATFTGETASGWQQVSFSTPVAISANTVYVASYHTGVGHYADDQYAFASAGVDRPPLHAIQDGTSGANGVYAYGSTTAFPNQGYRSTNYWVDVVFVPASGSPGTTDTTPPTVTSFTLPATSASLTVPVSSFTATDAVGVTGYLLTQSATPPSASAAGWSSTAPTSFTFASAGTQTLYAWARDAAGNVSSGASATVVITLPGSGTPNLVVDASRTYQTIQGMGASASVEGWDAGQLAPALSALAVDNGVSLFRVVRDRMDWVASESDIPNLHALDSATLTRIYEAPLMTDIWGTIGYLNSLGIKGSQICLDFMGWTAPWMGGSGQYGQVSTVTSGKEGELATMIASLVYYGRKVKNLDFTCLSPLNEPDWNGLEGPQVGAAQYATVAHALSDELNAMGLTDIRLLGPDTANDPSAYVSALRSDATAWARFDHLSWHTYSGPTSPGASYTGKTWWMTETAQWDSNLDSGGTPGVGEWRFGAGTFDIILQDVLNGFPAVLVWEGYDAWYYHHNAYSRWGLLSYDQNAGTYAKRKRFYANGHLTRWIRPGQQRVTLTAPQGVLATALVDPTAQTLSIVGHNQNGAAVTLQGSLTSLPFAVSTLKLYQTDSGSKNQTRETDVPVASGRFTVTVGADTVFTLTAGL